MAVLVAGVDGHRRVVHGAPRLLVRHRHVGDLVLDGLERSDGPVELHALLGVLDGVMQQPPDRAEHLGGQGHVGPLQQRLLVERPGLGEVARS